MMIGQEAPDHAAGVLLVDKPAGPTSHDVVARARRALGIRKIGHAGTLDPFATGLLLLCVGAATRLVEYIHLLPKRYDAALRLGAETSTHDPTGEVTRTSEQWKELSEEEVRAALEAHTGRLDQRPPAYSAVRVQGERAHRAARSGRTVELAPREVRVHRMELLAFDPPAIHLSVRVGTGTYVRALARDIGRDLGCGAHLRELRRTGIGPFSVEAAVPPEGIAWPVDSPAVGHGTDAGGWCSPAAALSWLPARRLSPDEEGRVGHGARIPRGEIRPPEIAVDDLRAPDTETDGEREPLPVVLLREGRLAAVAELHGEQLQPRKVFHVS